jgi:acyl carrier protein
MEEAGAQVLALSADVARLDEMQAVRAAAEKRFGAVHGVIHAAGVPGGGTIAARSREAAERVLEPKVRGTLVLDQVFGDLPLDCFVLFSSVTGVVPQAGQADYAAANCFLDAFAARRAAIGARRADPSGDRAGGRTGFGTGGRTVAIAWDAWREVGMAVATELPEDLPEAIRTWRRETLRRGLATAEGLDAFRRALASGLPQVVVSTVDLEGRIAAAAEPATAALEAVDRPAEATAHPRPPLANPYVAPAGEAEEAVAAVWQEMLGIDRVGIHDNFFDLGGNSLTGLRITRALKERLGASISDVSLYEAPTVAALTRLIEPEPEAETAAAAAGTAPAAEVASRGRGARRKERLMRKRDRPSRA